MIRINRDLCAEPPTAEEVALARQADVNSFVFFFASPEKVIRQKMYLDGFGYPADYLSRYVDRLKAVEPEQVHAAARTYLHLDRMIVLVVGQVDEATRAELAKIGPITEIDDAQLRRRWL